MDLSHSRPAMGWWLLRLVWLIYVPGPLLLAHAKWPVVLPGMLGLAGCWAVTRPPGACGEPDITSAPGGSYAPFPGVARPATRGTRGW